MSERKDTAYLDAHTAFAKRQAAKPKRPQSRGRRRQRGFNYTQPKKDEQP